MAKYIIAGSRSINDYQLAKTLIDEIVQEHNLEVTRVISGKAYRGVDKHGERWALENNIPVDEFPAIWDDISHPDAVVKTNQQGKKYNALAGHWRNEDMARNGDGLILLHDGTSRGSLDMETRALNHGLPVFKRIVDVPKITSKSKEKAAIEAIAWATRMKEDKTTLVLDTESCGGSKQDEVISLAVVRLHDGAPMFYSLLRPKSDVKFNYYATQIHGITEESLIGQPTIVDVWEELYELLHEKNVLAFNHSADKRMIDQTLDKHALDKPSINWYCIMGLFKRYSKRKTNTNLTKVCKEFNVKAGNHNALEDALAAARVVHRISQGYKLQI